MTRHAFLSRLERERLLVLERRGKARVEAQALEDRMTETMTLAAERGEQLERAPQKRGEPRKPIRRLTGLTWLHRKGKITDDQFAAGERYGACYRKAQGDASISSILNQDRGQGAGQSLKAVMQQSEQSAQARAKLAMYRRQLSNQTTMVQACNTVCGEELTPREANSDGHKASQMEAVLIVALSILADQEPQMLGATA